MENNREYLKIDALYFAWLISLAAMAGSLYFSEIAHLAPCVLCWYQRICFYPLVLLIPVAILRNDDKVHYYVLPLSIIGFGIALYHTLLQAKIIPEKLAPCAYGISCATVTKLWLGFVTIPMLSAAAFLAVIISMLIYRKVQR